MANNINLPKTNVTSKGDLITVIQNGVHRNITKSDLLSYLEQAVKSLSNEVNSAMNQFSSAKIDKVSPTFLGTVSGRDPEAPTNFATKRYVDLVRDSSIQNDGSTLLNFPLSYQSVGGVYKSTDVVPKDYIDSRLKNTLKTVKKIQGNTHYPNAVIGETFLIQSFSTNFATDGPEVQVGDIIICVENSTGGTHSEAGHQFAIINTNVVFATETSAGILRVASEKELIDLNINESAITPLKYKRSLELGSEHARTIVNAPNYSIENTVKGIIGVDSRYNSVIINLPQISELVNPSITKYLIKDEYLSASKNNITILCSGDNTIQGVRSTVIKKSGGAVKLYTDGTKQWFIENSSSVGADSGSGDAVVNVITDDVTNAETVSEVTGASEFVPVLSVSVDLREYPVGTGFKVVLHAVSGANTNNKGSSININGTDVLKSSVAGVANPNAKSIHHEATVLHSNTSKYFSYGTVQVGTASAAETVTNLDLDWDGTITISANVNVPTATSDVRVYALQIIPLK